jgi:hypothetical protein
MGQLLPRQPASRQLFTNFLGAVVVCFGIDHRSR